MKMPKGMCKVCGEVVCVKRDGTLRAHGTLHKDMGCTGAHQKGWKVDDNGFPVRKAQ